MTRCKTYPAFASAPRRLRLRVQWLISIVLVIAAATPPAHAQDGAARLQVVATFSILGDFARNIGGDRVDVSTLVGPNGDVHVYTPGAADAEAIRKARLVIVNGLGLEGWLPRLVQSSGGHATTVVASDESRRARSAPAKDTVVFAPPGRSTRTHGNPWRTRRSMSPTFAMRWRLAIRPTR